MSIQTIVVTLLTVLAARLPLRQGSTNVSGYWTATLTVVSYDYAESISLAPGKPHTKSNSAWVVHSSYSLYQNPKGVVRLELQSIDRNRFMEAPIDFALLDYNSGYKLAWDKDGDHVERSPLRLPVAPIETDQREILGHLCKGYRYDWQDSETAQVERTQWLVADGSFREPLLVMWSLFDKPRVLRYLELRAVTELHAVAQLPDSMFLPPPGMPVTDMGR